MKPFTLLIIFLFSYTEGGNITGVYWSDKDPCKLTLSKDSTFSYEYRFQFQYEHATGIWKKESKNKYVLNSFVKSKELSVNVHENASTIGSDSSFLSVEVHIPNQVYYTCEVFVNDTFYEKRNCDSLSSIVIEVPVKSIFFGITADTRTPGRFLDTLFTRKFYTRAKYNNNLKVEIGYIDSLFNYRVFDNKKIRIASNNVVFYDDKYNVRRVLRKK